MFDQEFLQKFRESNLKKAWPFEEAERILKNLGGKLPSKSYVLFETGYGPSGLPHIGTFGEVARTSMVRHVFEQISGFATRLICFSDDMDGLRKVPSNIPNREMVAGYIDKPLTEIPDPYGEAKSYGHYMNQKLKSFLDAFGFEYEFYSATDCYKSGMFDDMMFKVLANHEKIKQIILPTLGDERKKTYSPFLPIDPISGKVLQVAIIKTNLDKGTVTYLDDNNNEIEVPVTKGGCKLQWKVDFGMRWAALDVDYEMYGKDIMSNATLYSKVCQVLGKNPPAQFFYELFLDETGQKISKSKGNSITIDEWLQYAPLASLSLFMYQSPNRAKRMYFDIIPKLVDEYISLNNQYHQLENLESKVNHPLYHIHKGNVPHVQTYGLTFALLINLACVCNPENKNILWGFIFKYAPQASKNSAKENEFLDQIVGFAIKYYEDFVRANKEYLDPSQEQILVLEKMINMLESLSDSADAQEVQNLIYTIGMESGYENLKDFFGDLYKILLGQSSGPRLGSFIKLYGFDETIELIEMKINTKNEKNS